MSLSLSKRTRALALPVLVLIALVTTPGRTIAQTPGAAAAPGGGGGGGSDCWYDWDCERLPNGTLFCVLKKFCRA
jgi:hypothetical protein